MTGAESHPLVGAGAELQIRPKRRRADREHDCTPRLQPGLQTADRRGPEATGTRADDDDIEPIDHRRQHVDPRRIASDHHQPFQCHAHVDRSAQTDLWQTSDTDPRSLL